MAITEACQVWVEQRIQEELEIKDKDGQPKSARAIGRDIALEIYRHFEVRMNPETIKSRVLRQAAQGGSNEPVTPTPESPTEIQENQKPTEPRKHVTTGEKPPGGKREGSGRRPSSDAMAISRQIIRLLKKIRPYDPAYEEAITDIENAITELDGLPSVDEVDEEEMVL